MKSVRSTIKLISDHGPDSDLLATLFARHPDLRSHPKVDRIVRAFGNLTEIVGELESKETLEIKLARERKEREGRADEVEEEAFDKTETGSGVVDREEHRRMAMQGLNPDQPDPDQKPKLTEPTIPAGYRADGNIFQERKKSV